MVFPSNSKRLLKSLMSSSVKPSRAAEQACLHLLHSCNSLPKLLQIQSHLLKSGIQANPLVLTKFTSTCSSLGALSAATSLLFCPHSSFHLYDAFLFNTIIRSHAESNKPNSKQQSLSYYSLMLSHGISPNKFTFPFLLKACAGLANCYTIGIQIHASVIGFGFEDDAFVQNTLVHMYASSGRDDAAGIESARKVFDGMVERDAVSWSAMIGGYVRSGLSNEAVVLFREMQMRGVWPDEVTIITVLPACADLGALELAKWISAFIQKERIPRTLPLCNALLDALAKCGDVNGAVMLFERMQERSIVSWTSVIDGLAMHGRGREAVAIFEEMKDAGVVPDDIAFVGVLSACSHAHMVDEGCRYFDSMRSEFGIEPKIEHYGCMVDLFSRAEMVDRAVEFVWQMPLKPNSVIWRTLVSACRIHGKLELGESITKQLIKDEPTYGSNYVMLSNVYALTRRWEKKSEIRKAMSTRKLRKVPGCSLLELNGEIHEFIAGHELHSKYEDAYKMVEEVMIEAKRAGYVPSADDDGGRAQLELADSNWRPARLE